MTNQDFPSGAAVLSPSRGRVVRGALLTLALATALVALACGGGDAEIVVETMTATPTPTATPSPTPTETPVPWPIPAAKIEPGGPAAPGLTNPTSVGFSPPPQLVRNVEPNAGGIVRMYSPALGLNHVIEEVGIVDGVMESPEDGSYAVGWYPKTDQWDFGMPDVEGNLVFSAHETWNHLQGPFYTVHQANIGDDIYLEMEDGEVRHYQVATLKRYELSDIPMRDILWPSDRPEAEQWLTLYTCGGEIIYGDRGFGDYLARDVLVAKWVGMGAPEDVAPTGTTQQAVTAETAGD